MAGDFFMSASILYLGDTSLDGAAGYLAGLMTRCGWAFDYVPSARQVEAGPAERPLYVVSDYPAKHMNGTMQRAVAADVARGAGLIMIGGWESFCGCGGDWAGTPIGEILPVRIAAQDDRINCDQPALAMLREEHPMVAGLPWHDCPPTIGGFNAFTAKPEAQVILEVERFYARRALGTMIFEARSTHPLLVAGHYGRGRTVALATDVAPHWVGGLVDWGPDRVTAQAAGSWQIEVGNHYARLFQQLLTWAMRRPNDG